MKPNKNLQTVQDSSSLYDKNAAQYSYGAAMPLKEVKTSARFVLPVLLVVILFAAFVVAILNMNGAQLAHHQNAATVQYHAAVEKLVDSTAELQLAIGDAANLNASEYVHDNALLLKVYAHTAATQAALQYYVQHDATSQQEGWGKYYALAHIAAQCLQLNEALCVGDIEKAELHITELCRAAQTLYPTRIA